MCLVSTSIEESMTSTKSNIDIGDTPNSQKGIDAQATEFKDAEKKTSQQMWQAVHQH